MRRPVVIRKSSETTGTDSSCCRGKTSRNQPTQPATESTAPRTVTDRLVRSPANNKVNPKANTSGHAVDAGTSISRGAPEFSRVCSAGSSVAISSPVSPASRLLAAHDVDHGEDDHPNAIDKMPIHRKHEIGRASCRERVAIQGG